MAKSKNITIVGPSELRNLQLTFNQSGIAPIQGSVKNPYAGDIAIPFDRDVPLHTSSLGTPIYCDLTLGDPVHKDRNKIIDQTGKVWKIKPMVFETVLLTIDRSKNIVTTHIPYNDNTIKEYIGMDDYQVTINLIITGANGVYPRDAVSQLNQIFEIPAPIPVVSWWLQLFDIYEVVIQDFSAAQVAGEQSQQAFSIHAMSDEVVEVSYNQLHHLGSDPSSTL